MARKKQTSRRSGPSNKKVKAKANAKAKGKGKEKEKVEPPFSPLVDKATKQARSEAKEQKDKAAAAKRDSRKVQKNAQDQPEGSRKRLLSPSPPLPEEPAAKKRKKTDKKTNRFSTVWCSLSAALKDAPAEQKEKLKAKLDNLSVAMAMVQRLGSEAAMIDVLQALDEGRELPKLDQNYFRTLLAVINPGANTIEEETERARLFKLVSGMPTFSWVQGELRYTEALKGVAQVLNIAALQMATMAKNSVTFRIWSFQRDRLKDAIRALVHQKILPTIPGPILQDLLTDLQLFLRNPGNKRQTSDYGFKAPYQALNKVIKEEFAAFPAIPDLTGPITRKVLQDKFLLFLPYIANHLRRVEENAARYQQEKEKQQEKKKKKKKTPEPFIGTRKAFTLLPLYSYTRKMVLLYSSTWAILLRTLGIDPPDLDQARPTAPWLPLKVPGSQRHPVAQISTNGVKITFTRAVPKNSPSGDSVPDDEAEEDDEDAPEDQVDLDAIFAEPDDSPTLDISTAPPGLYSHRSIDFSAPAPPSLLGFDPGRGQVFAVKEECHCPDACTCRERAIQRHQQLQEQYPDRYVLQPHGLSTKDYHHQIGTYWFQRLIGRIKKAKRWSREQEKLLLSMTYKTASLAVIRDSLAIEEFLQIDLYGIYTAKRLARAKLELLERKRVFFINLAFSLRQRFPDLPVVAYGSAYIHPSRFKGHPATPVASTKAVFGALFRCILTPEAYTSQKCCICHQQLKAQEHQVEKLPKTKGNKISRKVERRAHKGILKTHGAQICWNKEAHGGRSLTWNRDVVASGNMGLVLRHSYDQGQYQRPPYLSPPS